MNNRDLFITPISKLYQLVVVMEENFAYILKELPTLVIADDLRNEIEAVCHEFELVLYNVNREIRNLEDKLGMHPKEEPFDPGPANPGPRVTMGFIEHWIFNEIKAMHELVTKLQALAHKDKSFNAVTGVNVLVTESATNILNAWIGIKEELDFISVHLQKEC